MLSLHTVEVRTPALREGCTWGTRGSEVDVLGVSCKGLLFPTHLGEGLPDLSPTFRGTHKEIRQKESKSVVCLLHRRKNVRPSRTRMMET